ncbi:MAG: HNH endonuclease [Bdellovibrionota bacterium]
MRLLRHSPEAETWVESGKTNFSTLAEVAKTSRKLGRPVSELMRTVEGKSFREARRSLLELLPAKDYREGTRDLPGGQFELRLVLDAAIKPAFEKLWAMRVHRVGGLGAMFADLVKLGLREYDPLSKNLPTTSKVTIPYSKGIRKATRLLVWKRDGGQCVYRDAYSGRKCETTAFLQFDHIVPRSLGGSDTHENLRLLCREHNLLAAADVFGLDNVGKKEPRGKQGPFT